MGALLAAKAYVDAGDLGGAREALQWALDNAGDTEFAPLARLRLSAVLLDDGKAQEALGLVEGGSVPEAFAGAFADRRGDLLLSLDKPDQAREAYESALAALGQDSPLHRLVQAKLEALGAGS